MRRKRNETREEHRIRTQRWMTALLLLFFVLFLLIWLAGLLYMSRSREAAVPEDDMEAKEVFYQAAVPETDDGRLPGDDVEAVERCYLTEEEVEAAENELIMQALIAKANRIDNCTVTWYTNDTCGKEPGDPGYGITASGFPTVEGLTCAVDNNVIPRYADVFVQFSDGTIRQYWATDCGVRGNHIDIFEPDYDTAIQNGCQSLTVWWTKEG